MKYYVIQCRMMLIIAKCAFPVLCQTAKYFINTCHLHLGSLRGKYYFIHCVDIRTKFREMNDLSKLEQPVS